jgi:hypothetical protein
MAGEDAFLRKWTLIQTTKKPRKFNLMLNILQGHPP